MFGPPPPLLWPRSPIGPLAAPFPLLLSVHPNLSVPALLLLIPWTLLRNVGICRRCHVLQDSSRHCTGWSSSKQVLCSSLPIAVATPSAAWNVFARSNTGIVGSNPTRGMDVRVYCVFVLSSSLPTGWSPIQKFLPTLILRNWSETKRFTDALMLQVEQHEWQNEEEEVRVSTGAPITLVEVFVLFVSAST
jgi:hypothetical protein